MAVLRPLDEHDYTGFAALVREGDALHHDALPGLILPPDQARRSEADFRTLLDAPDVLLLGAVEAAELAGLIRACYRETAAGRLHAGRRIVVIDELVVGSGFRRRGIGRALMTAAQDWAASKGAEAVELRVYEFNEAARAFYERLGYRTMLRGLSRPIVPLKRNPA